MRKIYITVLLVFAVSVFLFLISFVYLDKHNHGVYYYSVSIGGQQVGSIKVDKFVTEEKLIYKSVALTPFREFFTKEQVRLDLDRRYGLEDYQKEMFTSASPAAALISYAECKDGMVSMVSRYGSRFAYLGNMPVRKSVFVFEEASPVTYLPIIENYDFRIGKAQGFNAMIYISERQMPPVKRFVTLTSIKDEKLKIGRRKIKTENLLLKIKGLPAGSIWVAKSDKSLMMIEIPSMGLKITRSFEPKELSPKERAAPAQAGYISKEVTFNSKGRQLSGTLTLPAGEAKYPAVLLIWGAGPQDRNYQGLFDSMADYLSGKGYCALRFDKRGVGSSGGNAALETRSDDLEDVSAALEFLQTHGNVDAGRISILAHSEGALNAVKLAAEHPEIRAVVLMSPSIAINPQQDEIILRDRAVREKWDVERLDLALRMLRETRGLAKKSKRDWGYILGKKCYMKDVRDEATLNMEELAAGISQPVSILYGKEDTEVPAEYATGLGRLFSERGKTNHVMTCFGYLGHFMGKMAADGYSRMHYEVDREVAVNIKDWLDLHAAQPASQPKDPT